MKILSLFDGMACGMLAMIQSGVEVDRYVAYEIDTYATKTSAHNFPMIEHKGDVFTADFTEYEGFDFLVGGSPCTYWSIAQVKERRETVASGMGWELFSQYVRALHEARPRFFIYENNKSMSKAICESITETFGFGPICINSALVSAQNRQRLYWVGIRNEDGTYRPATVLQPIDLGIQVQDILDGAVAINTLNDEGEKSRTLMAGYYKYGTATMFTNPGFKGGTTAAAEPINLTAEGKARTLIAAYGAKQGTKNLCGAIRFGSTGVAEPINVTSDGKTRTIKAQYGNNNVTNFIANGQFKATGIAEPICVAQRGRYEEDGSITQRYEANGSGKTNTLTTVSKDNLVAVPMKVGALPRPNGELSRSQAFQVYSEDGKSVTLMANGGGAGGKTGLYAIRVDSEDKTKYPVYEVKDGMIFIKDKWYPIKLADGYYIIRKLSVNECKRLQTVPEWYEFPVSNSQAYKMLGNGWTVSVISHLINSILSEEE